MPLRVAFPRSLLTPRIFVLPLHLSDWPVSLPISRDNGCRAAPLSRSQSTPTRGWSSMTLTVSDLPVVPAQVDAEVIGSLGVDISARDVLSGTF